MKKSTYILIGFFGALCLLAFLLPPVLFTNSDSNTLKLSDNYVSKEIPAFSVIRFKNPHLGGDDPLFRISATSDSLKAGHIEINEAFANLKDGFRVSGDTLYIDMDLDKEDTERSHMRIEDTDKPAAVLYVDRSRKPCTLMMNPFMDVELKGLDGADFIVYGNGLLTVSESNIHTMEMMPKGDSYDYYGFSLQLKDNSNIGKLDVKNDGFDIKTSDSNIDTIFVSAEYVADLNLKGADFSTLITSDTCSSVNITLKGEATISKE